MLQKSINEFVEGQRNWLDPVGDIIGNAIIQAKSAGGDRATRVLDFLHGVWLEHPLHPALTDVPVGAWTAACALDALDSIAPDEKLKRGADGAICIGIAAGLGAAAAGLADWHYLGGRNRRLGMLHGLLNLSAVIFYTVSLAMRRSQHRSSGSLLSILGYSLASFSAYLGGELVYGSGIGVDRTAWQRPPKEFVAVLPEAELEDNKPRRVDANGTPVMLLRRQGRIHALGHTCTHLGGPLSDGQIIDNAVVCPWHGSHFDLDSGRVVHGPATFPEKLYEVRVTNGQIEVKVGR
ncbi:MAG: Rieske 2Fe-2S domain-containing protein [Chloroflexi bacterium]|nr:Rieske 2Fe-2S domain-containing protein [Chloroflexota bacterium]